MPYCDNPDCPHTRRIGRAPEYGTGASECSECGEPLNPGLLPAPPAPGRQPWGKPLRRRVKITLGAVVGFWLLSLLPSPLLDPEWIAYINQTERYWVSLDVGPFSLGLWPVVFAFLVVEVAALVVPRWNRRRHGDAEFRGTLNQVAIGLGLGFAFVQGYALAMQFAAPVLVDGGVLYDPVVHHPGHSLNVSLALTYTAGTGVLVLLALAVSRAGIGNGFAVLLAADALLRLLPEIRSLQTSIERLHLTHEMAALYGVGLLTLAAGLWWVLTRPIRRTRDGLPIPVPSTGVWPLDVTVLLLAVPARIALMVGSQQSRFLSHPIFEGGPFTLYMDIGIALIAAPLTAWLFYWRYRDTLAKSENAKDWFRARLQDVGLIVGVLFAWFVLHLATGPFHRPSTTALLLFVLVAILVDLWTELKARRRAPGGADLVPLASYQHPVDAIQDLDERPARAGAVLQHLRFRSLTYLLGPFVPVRVLGATEIPLQVTWSEAADDDLDDLAETVEDDAAADRLVNRLLEAAEGLVDPISDEDDEGAPPEAIRSHDVEGTPFTLTYRVQDTAAEILSVIER